MRLWQGKRNNFGYDLTKLSHTMKPAASPARVNNSIKGNVHWFGEEISTKE